ncbi:MAG TPA: hypothetical protein VJJ23_06600 [Candidatus Nanoarchaeia archaeon]|nr:hypothetical protein [Candidatus Nanoarchaeia archaeon]
MGNALAWFVLAILLAIIILTIAPSLKVTALDVIRAARGGT